MRDNKNNLVFLVHIKDALEQITNYSKSHTFKQFEDNEWDQAAVLRYLEVVGEASSKIDLSFRQEYPEIPWRENY